MDPNGSLVGAGGCGGGGDDTIKCWRCIACGMQVNQMVFDVPSMCSKGERNGGEQDAKLCVRLHTHAYAHAFVRAHPYHHTPACPIRPHLALPAAEAAYQGYCCNCFMFQEAKRQAFVESACALCKER